MYDGCDGLSPSAWRKSEIAWVSAFSVTKTPGHSASSNSSFVTSSPGRDTSIRSRSTSRGDTSMGTSSRISLHAAASRRNGPKRKTAGVVIGGVNRAECYMILAGSGLKAQGSRLRATS